MNATIGRLIAAHRHQPVDPAADRLIVFAATLLLPGDVVEEMLGQSGDAGDGRGDAQVDGPRPAATRALSSVGSSGLLAGDPGKSLVNGLPVAELIGKRLPNSLMLAGVTAALAVPIALALGITAAMRQGSRYDRVVSMLTVSMVSVPEFLIATIAVLRARRESALAARPGDDLGRPVDWRSCCARSPCRCSR